MPKHYDLTCPSQGVTAADFIADATGLSKAKIKDALNKGAGWWILKGKQQRLRRATKVLDKGSRIQFYYDEQILARKPETPVLLDDLADFSIWYKPHGVLAQGSQWGDHCSLLRLAELATKRQVFLIHRLDADAAGIMVIAHTQQAAAKLSLLFQGRELYKEYRAWITGKLACDTPLVINTPIEDKAARSEVSLIHYDAERDQTLVKVVIETGRKHQIRRHLAGVGHPIVNDRLYGQAGKAALQLVAHRLEFTSSLSPYPIRIQLPDALTLLPSVDLAPRESDSAA